MELPEDDVRMSTFETLPPAKRMSDEDDMPSDDESLKTRRLIDDSESGMSSSRK